MSRPLTTRLSVTTLEDRLVPAATLDLTAGGATGTINGAIFSQYEAQSTDVVPPSFLRIKGAASSDNVQEGYNTDARPLQFDEVKSKQYTHSIHLSALPEVSRGGTLYREFTLNIDQKNRQPLLSLDDVKIYVSNKPNLEGFKASTGKLAGQSPIYDMDAGGNHWVLLSARLNRNNAGDMLLDVPSSWFTSLVADPYVYLYSKFGQHYQANDGFQQWSAGPKRTATQQGSVSGMVADLATGLGVAGQTIFIDTNDNGTLDTGEVSAVTDANGNYTLSNLAVTGPTTFTVRIQTTASWAAFNDTQLLDINPGDKLSGLDWQVFQNSSGPTG